MNNFLVVAEKQMSGAAKARERAAEKRALRKAETAAQKALEERADLLALWKRWRRERCDALLAGQHGNTAQALVGFLRTLRLEQSPALVDLVAGGPWRAADADT